MGYSCREKSQTQTRMQEMNEQEHKAWQQSEKPKKFLVIFRTNTTCFIALRLDWTICYVGRWMLQMPIIYQCELRYP